MAAGMRLANLFRHAMGIGQIGEGDRRLERQRALRAFAVNPHIVNDDGNARLAAAVGGRHRIPPPGRIGLGRCWSDLLGRQAGQLRFRL